MMTMVELDISTVDKGSLAMLSGVGFVGIGLFFYFFLSGDYTEAYPSTIFLMLLCSLVPLFYLFEDINPVFNFALSRTDPDGFRIKAKRGSNFVAGMLLMGVAGVNLITYTNNDDGGALAIRLFVITLMTIASVFLLLYSMFMAEG